LLLIDSRGSKQLVMIYSLISLLLID